MKENKTSPVKTSKTSLFQKKSLWLLIGACVLVFIAAFFFGRMLINPKSTEKTTKLNKNSVTVSPTSNPLPSSTQAKNTFPSITPTPTNTPIPTQTPGNFAGHWIHNFGTMDLSQNGVSVTGTYVNSFDGGSGTVAGTVSGNTLIGTYQKINSGSITWTLNGNTFDGNWGGSSKWCGARSGTAFPSGCAFAGKWNINIPTYCPAGNASSTMELNQTDTSVSGNYCNGNVSGSISYSGGQAVVNGTFQSNGGGSGNVTFYLDGYNSLQFQGNYSSSTGTWCGWRDGSSQPSPCKK